MEIYDYVASATISKRYKQQDNFTLSVTLPTLRQASSKIAMIPLCCWSTRSQMILLLK